MAGGNKKGSIKKSNFNSMSWAKNVGKSLGLSAMDIITEMMPATMSNISTNKDTITEMYQTLRTSFRGKSTKRLDDMLTGAAAKNYDTAKTALKNAMEDIKTGNLYNKERMNASFDDGFDMDFDFSDDFSDDSFDDSGESVKPSVVVPDINITSNIDKNNPMVKAVETQSQVLLDTSETQMKQSLTIARSQMGLSENMHNQLMGGIQTINENLSLLVNFQSMNMTKYIAASMKYFDDNMKMMTDMFETYKKLNVPEEKPEQSSGSGVGVDDILTYEGGFDLKNYAQLVKKQVGDAIDSNIITSSIKMMFQDTDTLASMATQPLKFIADGIVKKFIPSFLKDSLSSFDKSLSSFIPAMLWKITGFKDNSNPILDLVGKIFGLNVKNKKSIDTSLYEKGKVPFDGVTRKSIVEVIPGYLSKIYSALSGKEDLVYNFEKGKFDTVSNLKKEHTDNERRSILGEYSALSEIKDRLNAIDIGNAKEKEDFTKRLEDLFVKITDREGIVNPHKQKDGTDDLASLFEGSSKELELARSLITSLDKDQIMKTFGRDVISARTARTKLLTDLEQNPGSLGAVMFNGLYSKDNDLATNNPLLKSYGEGQKAKRTSIFNPTDGYGNTSTDYLRDIKKILLEGINVFINRGGDQTNIQNRLNAMNSERLVSGLRNDDRSSTVTIDPERAAKNAERGISTFDSFMDLPDDPKAQEELINNYVRIRDEQAKGQNQKGFGINIGKFLTGNLQDKFNTVREFITNALSVPANAVKKFFNKISDSMYDLVFGKQEGAEEGQSFFSAVLGNIKRSFGNFFGFLRGKIFDPLKEALFGKEGLITKIKESDQYKMLKEKASQFGKYLFGAKNAEGIREGGLFSDTANEMGDVFKSFKYYFTGKAYKNSKGEEFGDNEDSVFGNVKQMFGSFKNTMKEYFFGKDGLKEKGAGVLSGIGSSIKQGFQNFSDAIFGPKMIGGKKNKKYVDIEKLGKTMKEHAPKALAHGIVGAGAGIIASMGGMGLLGTLIGGPIGGAAIGIAGSFLSKSDKFKNWLFGEEDANGERIGGFINKSTQKFFKDNKTGLIGGAAVGALKGILGIGGSGFLANLVGGPVAGAAIGMATQFLFKSEKFQKFMFGDEQKDGTRIGGFLNKIMGRTTDKDAKKRLGNIGAGALGGLGLGFITSKMGILGALSLGPLGGAIAGAAAGIALSSDKWKKYLFGEVDEETGEKKGGLLTKFSNFMKVEVFQALKVKMLDWKFNIQDWFSEKIAEPFLDSLLPFKEEISRFGKRIKSTMKNIAESIKNSNLFKGVKDLLIDPILDGFDKYVFQPFKTITDKLISGTGKVIGTIVSAPFAMLNKIADRLAGRHKKEGVRSVRQAALENLKNSDFVVGVKETFAPVKEKIDEITDYAKQQMSRFTGWLKGKAKGLLKFLGQALGFTLTAPFRLMGLPFKGISALSKFIKGRQDPTLKDENRIDDIYSGKRRGFGQALGDYVQTFNPFSKVRHDAKYYELKKDTFEERVLRQNDRFYQDAKGRWRDRETGKWVKRSLLSKFADDAMDDFNSGAFYEDERTQARLKRADERASKKKQRDELREDMRNQLNMNRELARAMGYDNFDADGKYAGAIYKDIDKQMEAQYGKDYKKMSRIDRDKLKADQLSKLNEKAIKENTGQTVTELQNLTRLMDQYMKNQNIKDKSSEGDIIDDAKSGVANGIRYAKNKAGRWYDTTNGRLVKAEVAEGKAVSATDPRNNPDNPEQQHEDGLDEVPFDGYKPTLHKGEAVVPKKGVKMLDKIKNVGKSAAGFMKSFSDSIGSVFSKSLAEEDARDDAEEAARAEEAEDQKKLEEKHAFTSRKTAAFQNAEKAKMQEKEEERSFRSRVLDYLSSGVQTAKEQAKGFFDVFGLKGGLITLGLAAALPWLTKFFKDPAGALLGLASKLVEGVKKSFNEWTGNTDEDGDRTNEIGDIQTNDNMKESMLDGGRSLLNKFVNKPLKNWWKDVQDADVPDSKGKAKGKGVTSKVDDIELKTTVDKNGKTTYRHADGTFASKAEIEQFEAQKTGKSTGKGKKGGKTAGKGKGKAKGVTSKIDDVGEAAAKGLDDVGEVAVKNADSVAKAGDTKLIKKFMNFAKECLGKLGDTIGTLITKAGGKAPKGGFKKVIKQLTGALTEKLLKTKIGKITLGFAKMAGATATFLLSDTVAASWGAVSGASKSETANLFGVREEDATAAMRLTSGIMKALLNISWAFVLDILFDIVLATTGIDVKRMIAEEIYELLTLGNDEKMANLKENQAKFDKDYENYLKTQAEMNPDAYEKDENGNIKLGADGKPIRTDGKELESKDSFNDRQNKSVLSKIGDGIKDAGKGIKNFFAGNKGDKNKYNEAKDQKKALDEMLKKDPSLKKDKAFMQIYKDVEKAVKDNKSQKGVFSKIADKGKQLVSGGTKAIKTAIFGKEEEKQVTKATKATKDIIDGTKAASKATITLGAKLKTTGKTASKDMESMGKTMDKTFGKDFEKYYIKPLDSLNKTATKAGKEFKKTAVAEEKVLKNLYKNTNSTWKIVPAGEGGGIGGDIREMNSSFPTQRLDVPSYYKSYNSKDKVFVDKHGNRSGIGGDAEIDLYNKYRVNSGFRTASRPNHNGVDLDIGNNSPIYAFTSGKVTQVDNKYPKDSGSLNGASAKDGGGFGNHVYVQDKFGNTHIYAHLNATSVKKGDNIEAGYQVGEQGHTGHSSGTHLHYEVRTNLSKGGSSSVNPYTYLKNYDGVNNMTFVDADGYNSSGDSGDQSAEEQKLAGLSGLASLISEQFNPLTEGLGKISTEFTNLLAPLSGTTTPSDTPSDGGITVGNYDINTNIEDGLMKEIIKKTMEITNAAEGNYDSVNPNDNGAWSVGIGQWHTSGHINKVFTDMASKLSGSAKAQAQKYAKWGGKVLNSSEKAEVEKFLQNNSSISKSVQDAYLTQTVAGNLKTPIEMYDNGTLKDYRSIILAGDIGNTGPAHLTDWKGKYKSTTKDKELAHVKTSLSSTDSWWGRQKGSLRNGQYYDGWMNRIKNAYSNLKDWSAPGYGGENPEFTQQDKQLFAQAYKSGDMSYADTSRVIISNKPSNIPEGIWDKIIEILSVIATNTGNTNESIKNIPVNNTTQINAQANTTNKPKDSSTNPMYDIANKRRREVTNSGYKTAKMIAQGVN